MLNMSKYHWLIRLWWLITGQKKNPYKYIEFKGLKW